MGCTHCSAIIKSPETNHPNKGYPIMTRGYYTCNSEGVIYLLKCPWGKGYVGQTSRSIKIRLNEYKSNIRTYHLKKQEKTPNKIKNRKANLGNPQWHDTISNVDITLVRFGGRYSSRWWLEIVPIVERRYSNGSPTGSINWAPWPLEGLIKTWIWAFFYEYGVWIHYRFHFVIIDAFLLSRVHSLRTYFRY